MVASGVHIDRHIEISGLAWRTSNMTRTNQVRRAVQSIQDGLFESTVGLRVTPAGDRLKVSDNGKVVIRLSVDFVDDDTHA